MSRFCNANCCAFAICFCTSVSCAALSVGDYRKLTPVSVTKAVEAA